MSACRFLSRADLSLCACVCVGGGGGLSDCLSIQVETVRFNTFGSLRFFSFYIDETVIAKTILYTLLLVHFSELQLAFNPLSYM